MEEMNVIPPGMIAIFDPTGQDTMRFYPDSRLTVKNWLGKYPLNRALSHMRVEWDDWFGDLWCFPCVIVKKR